ncbi:MAG: hypothetical protein QM817_13985 [Archangium sp.]
MLRCGCFLLLLVFASGCPRWTGVAQARQEVLREGLMDQRIRDGFKLGLARSRAGLDCRVGGDYVERCKAGVQNVWFEVKDGPEGGEIIVPPIASEAQISVFWRGVDLENYQAFQNELPALVADRLRKNDETFEPTWGLMAAATSSITPTLSVPTFGLKVGLRRWFSINYGGHLAFDYGFRLGTSTHVVGLRAGVELTRFTAGRIFGLVGSPPWSVSGFIGPRLQLPTGVPIPGIRTGVGVALTDWKMAPLVVEFSADTWLRGDQTNVELSLSVGVGI